ncbi:hypothetical protein ACF3MZ_09280 [Paenibacillaceae bacterium WGS1546]|uniref:hypothetical protein n=1 Tax=Cohnella sp. WGS1546 TaxID=3366810 RepID=UPI00372D541B
MMNHYNDLRSAMFAQRDQEAFERMIRESAQRDLDSSADRPRSGFSLKHILRIRRKRDEDAVKYRHMRSTFDNTAGT